MMQTLFTILSGLAIILLLLYRKFPYFVQDVMHARLNIWISGQRAKFLQTTPYFTVLDRFLELAKTQPAKPFIIFEDELFTYGDGDLQSNKVARALRQHAGLREGDTVALFLGNQPLFVWLLLGLAKLGCAPALMNYGIRASPLLQCLSCTSAKVLIADAGVRGAVEEVLPSLRQKGIRVFILGEACSSEGLEALSDKIQQASDHPLSPQLRAQVKATTPTAYFYTSGTTGLPKATVSTEAKAWAAAFLLTHAHVGAQDRLYLTLPLYHMSGLHAGLHGAIERGITVVLKRKFSASQFWADCRRHNVTVILYIGEILRYLCNTPAQGADDRRHTVRVVVGNGLRADVWRLFLQRFGKIRITEFYGSSDGNTALMNYPGRVGAVGKVNFYHRRVAPYVLVQFDPEREELVRDAYGLCVQVPTGETGLFLSKITARNPFGGYLNNPEQTERKKVRDVVEKGDLFLNSGDLMKIDEDGFVFFQDRVGDTFRWKGENVATTEVASILTMMDSVLDSNVYGVQLPGHEGRAGMATLTLKEGKTLDCRETFAHISHSLPQFAWPQFIRIQNDPELTGTFKQVKFRLVKEGFDPSTIRDPLFIVDPGRKTYSPLTQDCYDSIWSGKVKL
ncbi:long-chain fatty acid transport protein 2-like isoform X2 [Gadus chalcogrammus]|uniref:long-chain fatty acid transport protein 2-like isoform X2 n=1 Tax=Gadus chalcogrammus TaxID=1042646 RepID=UPI0024C4D8D3|nr:long-chain fatty acid transport protein 2-like isoform X2 [Gadus chalcogrammus]